MSVEERAPFVRRTEMSVRISTASGSERGSWRGLFTGVTLATARGTDSAPRRLVNLSLRRSVRERRYERE
jgi:hypothetical protein